MSRAALLEALERYRERYPGEENVAGPFLRFVESEPCCFERSHPPGHVTGSAWLVDGSGRRVLLTHHRKLDRWLQLGGHADGNPDPREVALREAEEESGLTGIEALSEEIFDLDIHPIPARGTVPPHLHYDVRYALQTHDRGEPSANDESHALAWFEIDGLERHIGEESILRMARKWQGGFLITPTSSPGRGGGR